MTNVNDQKNILIFILFLSLTFFHNSLLLSVIVTGKVQPLIAVILFGAMLFRILQRRI